jgi:DNA-binding transcriptional LysR family regulator
VSAPADDLRGASHDLSRVLNQDFHQIAEHEGRPSSVLERLFVPYEDPHRATARHLNPEMLQDATPGYLKKRGRPRSPEDLKKHDCLFFGAGRNPVDLRLENGDMSVQVALFARMIVSDMEILQTVATAGLGVALLPAFQSVKDLRAGRLKRVLPDWNPPSTPVHVVYPSSRHLSPIVKTFVDHLQERMTPAPWELGPMRSRRGA